MLLKSGDVIRIQPRDPRAWRRTALSSDPSFILFRLQAHCDVEVFLDNETHRELTDMCRHHDTLIHWITLGILRHAKWWQVCLTSLHLAVRFLKEHGLVWSVPFKTMDCYDKQRNLSHMLCDLVSNIGSRTELFCE